MRFSTTKSAVPVAGFDGHIHQFDVLQMPVVASVDASVALQDPAVGNARRDTSSKASRRDRLRPPLAFFLALTRGHQPAICVETLRVGQGFDVSNRVSVHRCPNGQLADLATPGAGNVVHGED